MKHVLVCTEHGGVFFGELVEELDDGKHVTLKDAQMCVRWSSDCHGVMGLTAGGPTASCRISPATPRLKLRNVTCIAECSETAVKGWKAEPWKN